MIIKVFTGLFLPAFYASTHGNAIKIFNIDSRQLPCHLSSKNGFVAALGGLFQIVAAVNDAGVEKVLARRTGILPVSDFFDFGDRRDACPTTASDFFAMRRVCAGNPAASILAFGWTVLTDAAKQGRRRTRFASE